MTDLAKRLAKLSSEKRALLHLTLEADAAHPVGFPLSFGQERLWFLDQLDPGNAEYNLPICIRWQGPLDVDALTRSLNDLVQRHEILRCRFLNDDGQPQVVIDPGLHFIVTPQAPPGETPAERESAVMQLVNAEAGRGFDLARGPLLRVCVWQLAEADQVLMLTLHHIIADGWSL